MTWVVTDVWETEHMRDTIISTATCSVNTWWVGVRGQKRCLSHPWPEGGALCRAWVLYPLSGAYCLISKMEGLWSRIARMILSIYCLKRKLISSCSFKASTSWKQGEIDQMSDKSANVLNVNAKWKQNIKMWLCINIHSHSVVNCRLLKGVIL